MKKFLSDGLIKAFAATLVYLPFATIAQDFPNKPVHIIVPWPPSGTIR